MDMEDEACRKLRELVEQAEQKEKAFLNAYQDAPLPLVFYNKDARADRLQGCIIAPSTRKGPLQATFFDAHGFLSDTNGTREECLKECMNVLGTPEPLEVAAFQEITASSSFAQGNLISKYVHSIEDQDSPSAKQILVDFCEKPKVKDDPIQLYRWLYRKAMERHHVRALPLQEGYGANIDEKTRMKLSEAVLTDRRWQKLPEEQKKASLKGEPYLRQEVLHQLIQEQAKGYGR